MNEFKIGDYSLFSNSSNAVTKSVSSLQVNINKCAYEMTKLCSLDVFAGPAADNALNGWNKVKQEVNKPVEALHKSSNYLNIIQSVYESSDKNNSSNIGGV